MITARRHRDERISHHGRAVVVCCPEVRAAERADIDRAEIRDKDGLDQLAAQIILRGPSGQAVEPRERQIAYAFQYSQVRNLTILIQTFVQLAPKILCGFTKGQI